MFAMLFKQPPDHLSAIFSSSSSVSPLDVWLELISELIYWGSESETRFW